MHWFKRLLRFPCREWIAWSKESCWLSISAPNPAPAPPPVPPRRPPLCRSGVTCLPYSPYPSSRPRLQLCHGPQGAPGPLRQRTGWLTPGSLGWRPTGRDPRAGTVGAARLPCLLPPAAQGRPPTPTPRGASELKSLNFFF